jgi:hypothetical protein
VLLTTLEVEPAAAVVVKEVNGVEDVDEVNELDDDNVGLIEDKEDVKVNEKDVDDINERSILVDRLLVVPEGKSALSFVDPVEVILVVLRTF